MKYDVEFKTHDIETHKTQKDTNQFPKIKSRKCRLRLTRVEKIMTTHEQCVKHNFVAPLSCSEKFCKIHRKIPVSESPT